jgi:hypothetical protein
MEIMSAPQTPARSRKKLFVAIAILAVVAIALVAPAVVYGGFTVPVTTVKFRETTGSLFATSGNATVNVVTVYEYMFSSRTTGMVRTDNSNVSSSRGTTNITMSLKLTNPSGQSLDLGSVNISGGIGARDHTIYLGASEGVRLPGSYRLDVTITASVAPVAGLLEVNLTTNVSVTFMVS